VRRNGINIFRTDRVAQVEQLDGWTWASRMQWSDDL
jgi:hypothetical protein